MLTVTPFHSARGCLSYLVADSRTKEAVIIDPSEEIPLERYLEAIQKNAYRLRFILETHTHADHVSSASLLQEKTGAELAMHYRSPSNRIERKLHGGDMIAVGDGLLRVLETPGHTDESVSFVSPGMVFTGDVLLIDATGRTDFQQGDSKKEYQSIWNTILALPDETIVYPAHDYKGRTQTTIKEERAMNPRLRWSEEEFVTAMDNYHPPKPELFDEAIAKNSA